MGLRKKRKLMRNPDSYREQGYKTAKFAKLI